MLVSLLFLEGINAQCNPAAFTTAMVNFPGTSSLQYTVPTADTADGAHVAFTCDAGSNDYLDNGQADYKLMCVGTAFTEPSPWPECIKKCTPPAAGDIATGYDNQGSTALVAVDAFLE